MPSSGHYRRLLLKRLYPVLKPLSSIYFSFVYLLFTVLNFLTPRRRVVPLDPTSPHTSLLQLSASEAAKRIRNGDLKSEDLVRVCIDRVQEVNPQLNAVSQERFSTALDEARAVDEWLREVDRGEFSNF